MKLTKNVKKLTLFVLLLSTGFVTSTISPVNHSSAANPVAFFYDLYYVLEDFNADGMNDGMTVHFDVDADVSDFSIEVTVIARLFDSSDILVNENQIRYITYYDDIDYRELIVGPVSEDGLYYIEIVLEQAYAPAEYLYSPDEYLYDAYKEWTVMVYLDGDNNLEPAALKDFNEMELAGGTTSDVNVVTIFDRCATSYEAGYYPEDWSGTRYYEVQSDSDMNVMNSVMVQDLGEQNMGSTATLVYFIDWAMTYYPADQYAFVFWDHGGGLDGVCWDEDNGNDNLDLNELYFCISQYHFDFIGFDTCSMGLFEILYQVKDFCDVFGASLIEEPGDGWDYYSLLTYLLADPSMTAAEFGEYVCETYIDFYPTTAVTFGIYDTSALTNFATALNTFSQALIDNIVSSRLEIYEARLATYEWEWLEYCDFHQFLENLIGASSPAIANAASDLLTMLNNALIASDTNVYYDFYGLWIYFPMVATPWTQDYLDNVFALDLLSDTLWDNFLSQWRDQVLSAIPEWDTDYTYTEFIDTGEMKIVYADLPDTPVDDAYIVIMNIESDMEVTLKAWNEELTFYTSSFMPLNIPETVGFYCTSPTNVFFIVECLSGSGYFDLDFYWVDVIDDSYEDNDLITTASSIAINSTYFMMGLDEDYFQIGVEIGDYVVSAVEFNTITAVGSNDFDLYIYDSSYTLIDASTSSSNHPEIVDFYATYTGVYYIRVVPYSTPLAPYYIVSTRVFSNTPPTISQFSNFPENPLNTETITITCTVTDETSIISVILSYNTSIGWVNITMSNIGTDQYQALIPAQINAICVEYVIYAMDSFGMSIVSDIHSIAIHEEPLVPEFKQSFLYLLILLSAISIVCIFNTKKK